MSSGLDFDPRVIYAFLARTTAVVDEERLRNWSNRLSPFDNGSTSSVNLDLSQIHMNQAPSPPASTWSGSTGTASTASTTFSRKSHRSHRTAASSPPRSMPGPPPSVFTGNSTHNLPSPSGCVLPCEYARFGLCTATFRPEDTQIWWYHIADSHLGWNMPHHCICWFCDQEFSSMDHNGDPSDSFASRLEHIRDHIVEQGYTASHMRPDYFLLEHIYRYGLLPEVHYQQARDCSEGPSTAGIVNHDFKPPERTRQEELGSRIIHDNGKEDRYRRRQGRHHRSGPRRAMHGVLA